jgi:hypothetical protein
MMAHGVMVLCGMVFGEVVSEVEVGRCPVNVILTLLYSVLYPVESPLEPIQKQSRAMPRFIAAAAAAASITTQPTNQRK